MLLLDIGCGSGVRAPMSGELAMKPLGVVEGALQC